MANPLINSNRNRNKEDFKPRITAKDTDFDDTAKQKITSVTFDTNLKLTNHTRNKLQAMASIGYSENQKTAVDVVLHTWYESLTANEQKEFDLQVNTLEQRDIRLKQNKRK